MSAFILICVLFSIQTISCQCIIASKPGFNGCGSLAYGSGNNVAYYLPKLYGSYTSFGLNGVEYGPSRQTIANAGPTNAVFVSSSSSIIPNGVSFCSDNLIMDGTLSVFGQLPVLATVALEGPMLSGGQGAVSYGCVNAMTGTKYISGHQPGFANPMGYNIVNGFKY